VGNWLYGVAHKTALKARAIKSRRRASEQRAGSNRPLESPGEQDQEPRALLDEELGRLPDRYRVPIVLCELEGMSLKDTARLLGCPLGTVASRLARARRLLARRLTRRGLRLSAGAVALVLSQEAFARLPAPLVVSTTEAVSSLAAGRAVAAGAVSANVTALAEGVLKAMFLTRLRIVVGMLFLLAVLGLCVGGLAYPTQAAGPGRQEEAQQRDVGPKWEYKALTRHNIEKLARKDSTDRLSDGLNVLGRDGWELAAVDLSVYFPQESSLSSGGSLSTYLFKRPR
jgi:hypothetical protein